MKPWQASTPLKRLFPCNSTSSPCLVKLTFDSEHTDFSESTEEIAPLTEEEKKAKLEELRERLKNKRDAQAIADKETARQNEVSMCGVKQKHPY